MRRIILASKSRARQKLLRDIGLKFEVFVSRAKESHSLKAGCGNLVVRNALSKVKYAAARFDSGVVIAADTVVLVGRKIIGKPKNIREARKTLSLLSGKPQWVYTGLAIIDIDNKKTLTGYDKTKVYMLRLSDEAITSYFRKISPLDKAGGFDIQGHGGLFIDRIEGCYYNVVGLPLAKLAGMLKKMGIEIFK